MKEIDQTMISIGAFEKTFVFKVFSPVFPPVDERLSSHDALTGHYDWTYKKDSAERKK